MPKGSTVSTVVVPSGVDPQQVVAAGVDREDVVAVEGEAERVGVDPLGAGLALIGVVLGLESDEIGEQVGRAVVLDLQDGTDAVVAVLVARHVVAAEPGDHVHGAVGPEGHVGRAGSASGTADGRQTGDRLGHLVAVDAGDGTGRAVAVLDRFTGLGILDREAGTVAADAVLGDVQRAVRSEGELVGPVQPGGHDLGRRHGTSWGRDQGEDR